MLRFDLSLPSGPTWVDLPCDTPEQGLSQARALAAALPVLAALEAWWGIELPCPTPVAAGLPAAQDAHPGAGLRLRFDMGSALAGGQLRVPWAAIPPGRPAPAGLPVQWPQVTAQMRLQTLAADRIDPRGLVPGAVLLLPAAFARAWAVQLQAIDSSPTQPPRGWLAPATWLAQEDQVLLHGQEPDPVAAPSAGDDVWSAWLVPPLRVDLRAWLGGVPPPAPPALAGPDGVELRRAQRPVAWGRLLPCGAGWALRLDRVETPQTVPAWT